MLERVRRRLAAAVDTTTARAACAPELDVLRKRTVWASTVESVDRKIAADAAAAAPMPITN